MPFTTLNPATGELIEELPVWDAQQLESALAQSAAAVEGWQQTRMVERSALMPVLDHRNRPIQDPDVFQLNTSMQRSLVKAIALHGVGLFVYSGEDVPGIDSLDLTNDIKECTSVPELMEIWNKLNEKQKRKYQKIFSETRNAVSKGGSREEEQQEGAAATS